MLVRKDVLVPRAEVAHLLVVDGADVAMQVGPAEAGKVALVVGAVVPEQEDGVADDVLARILDADVVVGARDVAGRVVLVLFDAVVGENNEWCGLLGGC